jgi:hypothetical protein
MSEQTAVNNATARNDLYVTSDVQEGLALHGRLLALGIDSRLETRIASRTEAFWVVCVEFPMDLERARTERERYFRDMGWL